MSLQNDIKQDLTNARFAKNLDVVSVLSTLLGEAAMVGKSKRNGESTDDEVIQVVKKFLANNTEMLNHYEFIDPNSPTCQKLRFEAELYSKYMPVQLTNDELLAIIKEIIANKGMTSIRELGILMGELKKLYPNQYDQGVARQLIGECLV